jgi:hypothetical protein
LTVLRCVSVRRSDQLFFFAKADMRYDVRWADLQAEKMIALTVDSY